MKKSCWWLEDEYGIYCTGYRKKETALKAMEELFVDDGLGINEAEHGKVDFILENVKEETAVFCDECEYYTIDGDAHLCSLCDKNMYRSIKSFTIYFNSL